MKMTDRTGVAIPLPRRRPNGFLIFAENELFDRVALCALLVRWIALNDSYCTDHDLKLNFQGVRSHTLALHKIPKEKLSPNLFPYMKECDSFSLYWDSKGVRITNPEEAQILPKTQFSMEFHLVDEDNLLNPWMSVYFVPHNTVASGESSAAFVELMQATFQEFSGLTGYIDPFLTPISYSPTTPYEVDVMNLFCSLPITSLWRYCTSEHYAQEWLRALSWGMFLTEKHLAKIGSVDDILKKLQTARITVAALQATNKDNLRRWYLQLASPLDKVLIEDYTSLGQIVAPILPESIAQDCEGLEAYLKTIREALFAQQQQRNSQAPSIKRAFQPTEEKYSFDPAKYTLVPDNATPACPIWYSETASDDLSEMEEVVFLFTGTFSEEQRGMLTAVFALWSVEAFADKPLDFSATLHAKNIGLLQFEQITMPDGLVTFVAEQAKVSLEAPTYTWVSLEIETGWGREASLAHLAATLEDAAQKIGIALTLVIFGMIEEI